ncbi:MAG: DNA alkylation repair protein [Paludibacteraceae bacterium]|nr:DNA alkylation repair protein [Paludibacteraceae bacterium]
MERVFFPFDAELKNELDEIKLAIQGEQNGMASYQMGQMAYKKNYGVSYVALRNIARQYQPNKKLAFCLWNIGYRETMLLSLLLMPAGELDEQEAYSLIEGMQEMELVEFACRGVLGALDCAAELVVGCLSKDAKFSVETAYLLGARLLENGTELPSFYKVLFDRVGVDLAANKPTVARAVSNFLKQLGLYDSQSEKVMAVVDRLASTDNMQLRWVAEEVRTFVEYTGHKA